MIYPPTCAGCGSHGYRFCDECTEKLHFPTEPTCQVCGLPLNGAMICGDCAAAGASPFLLRSWGVFDGPLRNAIHRLKYNSDIGIAELFAGWMAKYLRKLDWGVDVVVPVPLTAKRKKERGFNQSALLAWLIALELGIPFSEKGLIRVRSTISQTRLSAVERRLNVANAFRAEAVHVRNRHVVVIDDLATTCATLRSCTAALYQAGAGIVYSFTLARTI